MSFAADPLRSHPMQRLRMTRMLDVVRLCMTHDAMTHEPRMLTPCHCPVSHPRRGIQGGECRGGACTGCKVGRQGRYRASRVCVKPLCRVKPVGDLAGTSPVRVETVSVTRARVPDPSGLRVGSCLVSGRCDEPNTRRVRSHGLRRAGRRPTVVGRREWHSRHTRRDVSVLRLGALKIRSELEGDRRRAGRPTRRRRSAAGAAAPPCWADASSARSWDKCWLAAASSGRAES